MIKLIGVGQVEEGLIGLDPTDPAVTAVNCDRITPRFDVCVITAIFRRCAAYITHVFDLDSVPDLRQLVDVPLLDDGTSATESLTGDGAGEVPIKWLTCGEDSIGPAIEDDVAVFITQQRGVRSRGFKGAYLSGQEKRIARYHERIDDYIHGTR